MTGLWSELEALHVHVVSTADIGFTESGNDTLLLLLLFADQPLSMGDDNDDDDDDDDDDDT